MIKEDFEKFVQLMDALARAQKTDPLEEVGAMIFFEVLKDFTFEEVTRAAYSHLRESKFFPKPAEIISQITGPIKDYASLAFYTLIKNLDSYASIRFDDPLIHYAIKRLGGWEKVCRHPEEDLKWLEKDFCRFYNQGAGIGATWGHEDVPDHMVGIIEHQNCLNGYGFDEKKIKQIGAPANVVLLKRLPPPRPQLKNIEGVG